MSFLRPTVSSRQRAVNGGKDEQHLHGGAFSTAGAAQPLAAQSISHNAGTADYSHVSSRIDTGLRSRVRTSSLTRRPASTAVSRSPSLREFSDKCDSVIQRAQEVLERTREQELKVTKALEERQSKSPARQATPPPQRELTPQRMLATVQAGLASHTSSPAMLNALYTTPVPLPRGSSTLTTTSPSLPPLPAPPPTPAGFSHSPPPTQPDTDKSLRDTVGRLSPPSIFQRLRQSWQRGSGQTWEAHATSPMPSSPDGALHAGTARVSPRKSVRFASPDKLETVTPTKVVVLWSDDDEEDEETSEDEEEEELLPTKKMRAESSDCSRTPHRGSVVVPPAPPPSAVKSGIRSRSESSNSLPSSRSPHPSHSTASPPPSYREGTRSPSSMRATSPRQRSSSSDRGRGGRSSTSSSRPPMDHDEVKEYVMHHTIRRSLSRISRANMEDYLRGEGVALPKEVHLLKRHLLAHIRALIKQEMPPH